MNQKAKNAGKTAGLGGIGGLVAAGGQMLIDPAIFKDQTRIPKWFWTTPAAELLLGAIGGAFPRTALVAAGLSGAAILHFIQNMNLAIMVKRNQGSASAPPNTSGLDAGSMVDPRLLAGNAGYLGSGPSMNTGAMYDEVGALIIQ